MKIFLIKALIVYLLGLVIYFPIYYFVFKFKTESDILIYMLGGGNIFWLFLFNKKLRNWVYNI